MLLPKNRKRPKQVLLPLDIYIQSEESCSCNLRDQVKSEGGEGLFGAVVVVGLREEGGVAGSQDNQLSCDKDWSRDQAQNEVQMALTKARRVP